MPYMNGRAAYSGTSKPSIDGDTMPESNVVMERVLEHLGYKVTIGWFVFLDTANPPMYARE